MTFDKLPQLIQQRLTAPLPGQTAWKRFEADLSYGRHAGPSPEDARRAAVLVLLYPIDGRCHVVLTMRPDYAGLHAGQISFPGGQLEYGESTADAALRELNEELGTGHKPRLLGKLTPLYVFVSNFRVTPWVAILENRPEWEPCPREVAAVIEAPLADLSDCKNWSDTVIERGGLKFTAPCFDIAGISVWGATSMVLSELLMVLEQETL